MSLRVALLVPDEGFRDDPDDPRHAQLPGLVAACQAGEVDLVVVPEAYYFSEDESTLSFAEGDVDYFGVPVLVGVETAKGFNVAQYLNPNPAPDETARHLYVKHSTSRKLAFDWPRYGGTQAEMFTPILLGGARIGVQICHDLFFSLLGARWGPGAPNAFINLTGGGVNVRKWSNMIRARSLDFGAPYLCAMSLRGKETSTALAFREGHVLLPVNEAWNSSGSGWAVVDIDAEPSVDQAPDGQAYTDKTYQDITVAFGSEQRADVTLTYVGGELVITGADKRPDGWFEFNNAFGRTGLLPLPIAALNDPRAIHFTPTSEGSFDHHLVLFHDATANGDHMRLLNLMKARAIEHRIGVLLWAGAYREALKTSRYKNIQRFRPVGDVFGFDATFLGGPWSTACSPGGLGITKAAFRQYLALLKS